MRRTVTRRTFLKGAAVATGVTAVALNMAGCKSSQEDTADPTVVDSGSAVDVFDEYESSDASFEASATWELALGCVPFAAEGTWIPVLAKGDTATQLVKGSVLSLVSGSMLDVVASCASGDTGWVIYGAACSDDAYAWVELSTLTREWALYAVAMKDGAQSGKVSKLQSGTSDYDPPQVACSGKRVFWLAMPSASGQKTSESSYCYEWKVGDSEAAAVLESPGRFGCPPSVSGGTITLAPRVRADEGVYYGITAYDVSDDLSTQVDQLVLPSSVKPFYATRIGDSFAFSIEANYDSGGLLGQMGTYIGNSSGPFVMVSREPAAQVAGTKDGVYAIKSKASYFVVDTSAKTYGVISAVDHSIDYGEYPATEGLCSAFTTFSTVKDADTGYPANVTVRTFAL